MKRCVVKIGSALVTNDGHGLAHGAIHAWVQQMARLHSDGWRIALVSSGSIAEGMRRLNWLERPQSLHQLQAAAAVGQMGLIQAYESSFQRFNHKTAQILLTHEDVAGRRRYLNARSTLRALLEMDVIPVINENDTVATAEIRLGDNDTLAGLVANLIEADELIILTDQQGLFTDDPRTVPEAKLVRVARAGDPDLMAMARDGSVLGRGGMRTKLEAARLATRSGTRTHIVSGHEPDVLLKVLRGVSVGTRLEPCDMPMAARKRWLASVYRVQGELVLDEGAVRAVREQGRSLLAVGLTEVRGEFERGALLACMNRSGMEIARGLVNYDSAESRQLIGCTSTQITQRLGHVGEPEIIHRDNLVIMES